MRLHAAVWAAVISGATLLGSLPAIAQSNATTITYRLFLEKTLMGTESFKIAALSGAPNSYEVATNLSLSFKPPQMGGFAAIFTGTIVVNATSQGRFENGQLVSFQSTTDDRGDKFSVQASRQGDTITIKRSKKGDESSEAAPGTALPNSFFAEPLYQNATTTFSTKEGDVRQTSMQLVGTEQATLRGQTLNVRHYKVDDGEKNPDIWFLENGLLYKKEWQESGSKIIYILQ